MWQGKVSHRISSGNAAQSGACRTRRFGARRLQIESLEPRNLLSVNMVGPDLPIPLHGLIGPSPAAQVAAANDPMAWLIAIAWYGKGQIQMRATGDRGAWVSDTYTDPGSHATATGPGKWAWFLNDSEGDPEAYVAKSTPTLKANFSLDSGVKTLQVQATGGGLSFESAVVGVKGLSNVNMTLSGKKNVGDNIDNREVVFQWQERINGGGWIPEPGTGTTSQHLFVTAAMPLNSSADRPTAKRIDYATNLAKGKPASDITAIANAIDLDAMARYANRQTGVIWTGELAWQAMYTNSFCADLSWLMDDGLGVIGIASEVRFVYPRAQTAYMQPTGVVTHGWEGLLNTAAGWNEYRTNDFLTLKKAATDYLGYIGTQGEWENYEACCYVKKGLGYYLGGDPGKYASTAIEVLNFVTNNGANQRWQDQQSGPAVHYPTATPPTY